MGDLAGYSGRALRFLTSAGASIGDVLELTTEWGNVTGTLVPRYLHGDQDKVVLKLASGYNVGLEVEGLKGAVVKAHGKVPKFSPPPTPKARKGLPRVLLLGTGGTIASRVDYRTGAVHPAVSSGDLHALVPELSEVAEVEPRIVMNVFSENITPTHWTKIANIVVAAVRSKFDGVVITHGTDTLGYTAAALSFALAGIPIPVILVGAQRSSDRPSSDATLNLVAGVTVAARASFSGVYVAMHLNESDERVAFHRGTRVRKNHTSRRDAFVSVGVPPAAIWGKDGLEEVEPGLPPRGDGGRFRPRTKFDSRVSLLKFYPSMPGRMIRWTKRQGYRGLVLEGTGLGHVSAECLTGAKDFMKEGGLVAMTSQCINGRVDLNVYDTGRDLLRAGVIPLQDMLAETALVKMMWALSNSKNTSEARAVMAKNLVGEMTDRTFPSQRSGG
jgi:glutamyl-tRNA(Gln) amidotransferase subunit D